MATGSRAVDNTENESANFAFANYLGSGIYRTQGQDATVINLPFSYTLGNREGPEFRLRLPVSVGFFDFDVADVPEGIIPTSIDTLTFVPGIEFDYRFTERFKVTPYIDLGLARNLSSGNNTAVYSTGISSYYELNGGRFDPLWVNRLYYAGYYSYSNGNQEEYAAFQTGIDVGLPYHLKTADNRIQPTLFATTYWYFVDLTFNSPGQQDVSISNSYEVGFTLAAEKPMGYSILSVDRLGMGYRFGNGFYAWHLLFDLPI